MKSTVQATVCAHGHTGKQGVPGAAQPRCENGLKHPTCTFQGSEGLLLSSDVVGKPAQSKDR